MKHHHHIGDTFTSVVELKPPGLSSVVPDNGLIAIAVVENTMECFGAGT